MYNKYPNKFDAIAGIISYGQDEKGLYVLLSESLFYPQGGGQPSDQGEIIAKNIRHQVLGVRNIDGQIRHYITGVSNAIGAGDEVRLIVDEARRKINSKYHTAGHLLAAVTEKTFPELSAIKGHQFPGEAYVEFEGGVDDLDGFLNAVSKNLKNSIVGNSIVSTEEVCVEDLSRVMENLPKDFAKDKAIRVCHIEGFEPVPCGGTHVKALKEIAGLQIKKCKSKKGKTKIFYEVL